MQENSFDGLVGQIESVSTVLREDAKAVINRNVTARAWLTGYYIVEYEQHGQDRAKYGDGLLKSLSMRLGVNEYSVPSLKKFRQFYKTFPELASPIAAYLDARLPKKGYSPIIQLPASTGQIVESPIIQSQGQEVVVWHGATPSISPWALFGKLSYTHVLQCVNLDDLQRTFYAFEAIRGTWSVKELRRQINSNYYVRSGWSGNPSKLSALTMEKADKDTLRETLRSPHVFEFLGLASKDVWEESDLEQAIIDHLKDFILEMGLGFCFEARQKKILIDDQYHRIDLVFYHRILKCHVLVELKARIFDYGDAAQLGVYLAYYRKNVCRPDDNPPIGILLCTEAGREMAEYVSTFIDPSIFISKYAVELPPKEKIEAFLRQENNAEQTK